MVVLLLYIPSQLPFSLEIQYDYETTMLCRNVEKLIDNMLKNCLHEIRIFIPVSIQGDEIKNEYICEKVAIALIAAKASEGCLRCFNHMQ